MAKSKPQIPERLVSEIGSLYPIGMTERLVQHITSWVVDGHVLPGTKLPAERDLSAMLRVSRTSVRRALKALEVMGAVEARQGSGTYLTSAAATILRQPKDIRMPLHGISFGELYQARRAIEAETAAGAASHATKRDVKGLQQEIDRMQRHLLNPLMYHKHDMAFHRKIALAAGNSVFAWFQELAVTMMTAALEARARAVPLDDTLIAHRAIFEAIAAKDPDAARAAMLEHLMLTKFYQQDYKLVELRITASRAVNGKRLP